MGCLARPSARDHAAAGEAHRAPRHRGARGPPAHAAVRRRAATGAGGARALAQEPRAIVLDEPTASLDFGNQGRVLREIRRLAGDGLAVLFTTHDPNHALRCADRVLLVRPGGPLAQGPACDLIAGPWLAQLYGTPVEELEDTATGRRGYLPP
jgi:iron complex transport system ATP-binding protein